MNLEELSWEGLRELTNDLTLEMEYIARSRTTPDEFDAALIDQYDRVHAEWRRRVGL